MPDDARTARYDVANADCFITNPPWSRDVLHPLIINLSDQAPAWLLIDADWVHTRQSIPFLPRLRKIISIGESVGFPTRRSPAKTIAVGACSTPHGPMSAP